MDNHINEDLKEYYNIKQFIKKGSFGEVYIAENKNTKEKRAIKIFKLNDIKEKLKEKFFTNEITDEINDEFKKYINSIMNEIENMKICVNKYSVKYYETFKNENILAIVMELCDENLSNILRNKNEGFNIKEIYEIMYQLNKTFKIMRENIIVHRDIKLDNILIKYEKNNILNFVCKLADYGISKKMNDFTICKTYVGTAITMAPEILKNKGMNKEYDEKCDLWSIGVIIYELYFKRSPFNGNNEASILNLIKNQGKKLLKKTGYYQLDDLIGKLLIEDPINRLNWDEYFNHSFFKDEIIVTYKTDGKVDLTQYQNPDPQSKLYFLLYIFNIIKDIFIFLFY